MTIAGVTIKYINKKMTNMKTCFGGNRPSHEIGMNPADHFRRKDQPRPF